MSYSIEHLGRPFLIGFFEDPQSIIKISKWVDIVFKQKDPLPYLSEYNAVVTGPYTNWLKPILIKQNWLFIKNYMGIYELWLSPRCNF